MWVCTTTAAPASSRTPGRKSLNPSPSAAPKDNIRAIIGAVREGIGHGWLTPRISQPFPADAAEAHRLLDDRKTIGKVLLATGD